MKGSPLVTGGTIFSVRRMVLIFWIYKKFVVGNEGITAYNCTHEAVTSTEFSLLPPEPCPDFRSAHVYSEEYRPIQLLQKKEFRNIHGYSAKVVRTLFAYHCDGTPLTNAYHQRVIELDRMTVMRMYSHLLYKDILLQEIGASPISLIPNGTSHKIRNLKGWTDSEANCGGEEFTIYGERYMDSVLQGTYEILMYDGSMTVDLENDLVRTFSGTTCEYSKGHCIDYVYGDIFWDRDEHDADSCDQHTYIVLFEGSGVMRFYEKTHVTEAARVITVTEDAVAFSLLLTEKVLLCNQQAYRSEHPKLFVLELHQNLKFFQQAPMHSLDLDINAFRASKFIHLERHLGQSIKDLNANVMNKLCILQTQVIANLQSLAYADPMEFAHAWKKKPGYTALIRGEVAHVIDCIPVQVKVQSAEYCSHELPVRYMNETMYMHPRSHVLSRFRETVPCTPLYPVKYRLRGTWFTLGPNLVASHPPKIIKTPLNFTSWKYKKLHLGTAGIYSLEDLNRQRSSVLFPVERRAITRQIADAAVGVQNGPRSFDMFALIDPDHFKTVITSYWDELDSSIRVFGTYSGAILGIGFLYRMCTMLCNGALNGTAVAKMFGKMWGVVACLFPGVAHIALLYGKEAQNRTGKTKVTPKGAWKAYRGRKSKNRNDYAGEDTPSTEDRIEAGEAANGIMV